MKKVLLALSLALTMIPVAALADDSNTPGAPPALTAAQRQAMFKTFQTFHQQEEQLHQQMRTQVLASMTPAHRSAVAGVIGQLAVAPNPNPKLAAQQLDALLSQGEQQRILAAHSAFRTQSKTLHDQMRAQLKSELPAGMPGSGHSEHANRPGMPERSEHATDAGTLLLKVLSPKSMDMEMGHHMWGGGPPPPPHR